MASKNKILTSPKGTAIFPSFETPDTKFDAEGVYKSKLRVNAKEGAEYAKLIDAEIDAVVAKHKAAGVKNVKRADAPYTIDEETGDYIFSFKVGAFVTVNGEKKSRKPTIYNAEGKPVTGTLNIGGGSTVKIAALVYGWQKYTPKTGAGVTLQPVAVQVIDLVTFGQRDASAYGFGQEEGFSGQGSQAPVMATGGNVDDEEQENEDGDGSAF